jgi:BlaI family transcriptional regulator, penicillinase repressor
MSGPQDEITDAELSVMEVLWDRAEGVTVRQIVLAVYGRHEHSLHGGVKSFLDRLIEKSYVKVDKCDFAHRFFPTVSRQQFVGLQLQRMADSHFDGALAPLLLSLVKRVKLASKDRAAIEKIIGNIRE